MCARDTAVVKSQPTSDGGSAAAIKEKYLHPKVCRQVADRRRNQPLRESSGR